MWGPEISSPIRLGAHAPQGEQRLCEVIVEDGAGTTAEAIRPVAGNLVPPVLPVGRLAEAAAGVPGEPGRLPAFPTAGGADIASNRAAQSSSAWNALLGRAKDLLSE
jgi:hypothetical protein